MPAAAFKPGSTVAEIVGQINWVLFVEEEFRGNQEDYYDPRNSYLNEVLDRGLGIPITLSLVYWTMAERLGLAMAGVDLPLHFMLRVDDRGQPWFVDPFHGGVLYDRRGCEQKPERDRRREVTLPDAAIQPCSSRVLISRMLRNLKVIYGRTGEIGSLLPIQRRLTALNRSNRANYVIWVFFACRPTRLGEAIEPLQAYLESLQELTTQPRSGICWEPFVGKFSRGTEQVCARRQVHAVDLEGDPEWNSGTIQELSGDQPMLVDTALAGTRARRRR